MGKGRKVYEYMYMYILDMYRCLTAPVASCKAQVDTVTGPPTPRKACSSREFERTVVLKASLSSDFERRVATKNKRISASYYALCIPRTPRGISEQARDSFLQVLQV